MPGQLRCPAVLVYGTEDALIAPSVARNRASLEDIGFVIAPAEGLDHQTCVEAVSVVTELALDALKISL